MEKGIFRYIAFMLIISSVILGCSPGARYKKRLKEELVSGIRNDSLFMGLYLGMPQKDFYIHCWQLNRKGLIKQGSNNTSVEYQMKNELKYPAVMDFYPNFIEDKIAEMPVKFVYTGWAPWNKKLSSDSLQFDVLNWIKNKYGDHFLKVSHSKKGSAFIKINGNRRITVFKTDEMNVWAVFSDMSVIKDKSLSTGIEKIPADSSSVVK